MSEELTIQKLLHEMQSAGEAERDAAQIRFVDLYYAMLTRWAERRLRPELRALLDPEAVANSVCRSAIRRVGECPSFPEYFGGKPEKILYRLLMQKLYDAGIEHLRERRNATRTSRSSELTAEESSFVADAKDKAAKDAWLDVAWADSREKLKKELDETDQLIVDRLIEGCSMEEIGRELGISGTAVKRRITDHILPVARRLWPEWHASQTKKD